MLREIADAVGSLITCGLVVALVAAWSQILPALTGAP